MNAPPNLGGDNQPAGGELEKTGRDETDKTLASY